MKVDLLEEYKELYYKEIEHSERLNNKINICITFLTLLGSAQVLLWSQLKNLSVNISVIFYLFFCVASFVLFIICLYNFVHTFSGYQYNYFPIKEIVEATTKTYKIAGDDTKNKKRADNHIYNMYCERFINDAINNRKCNTIKNNRYRKLIRVICISYIVTIIAFSTGVIIDYYESQTYEPNAYHIIIDGGIINVR